MNLPIITRTESVETKTVQYMNGTVQIPATHTHVAVVKSLLNGKHYLRSFAEKPQPHPEAGWVSAAEWKDICEVEAVDTSLTLRNVVITTDTQALESNIEELVYKLMAVMHAKQKDSSMDIIHAVFCPEHGIFTDFCEHSRDMLDDHFDAVEGEEAIAEDTKATIELIKEQLKQKGVNVDVVSIAELP